MHSQELAGAPYPAAEAVEKVEQATCLLLLLSDLKVKKFKFRPLTRASSSGARWGVRSAVCCGASWEGSVSCL